MVGSIMSVKKKRNGKRTGIMQDVPSSKQRAPNPVAERDPKLWKKTWIKDSAGFKKIKWVKRGGKTNIPPVSAITRRETLKKQAPGQKYAGKPGKALPLSAEGKGVTSRIGKGYKRKRKGGSIS